MDLGLTEEFSDPTKLNADQTETRSGFTTERQARLRTHTSSTAGSRRFVRLSTLLRNSQASRRVFRLTPKFRADRNFGRVNLKITTRTGIGNVPVFSGEMVNRTQNFRPTKIYADHTSEI